MSVKRIRDEGQTLMTPTGKVLGIVDTREEFDVLVKPIRSFHEQENANEAT